MSEIIYDHICPNCGHKEHGLSRGGLLFGDYESEIYYCEECNKIQTISLVYDAPGVITQKPMCKCCGKEVRLWSGNCPRCGTPMDEKTLYDIII